MREMKEILIREESDWKIFDKIVDILINEMNAKLLSKADGLDQRYWDFKVNGIKITLHLEHYLGIMIFLTNNLFIGKKEEECLENIGNEIKRKIK